MGIDVVDVRVDVLGVGSVVDHGYFHRNAAALAGHVDDLLDERIAGLVDIAHELFQAFFAVEDLVEHLAFLVHLTFVGDFQLDAGVEVGQLAQAGAEGLEVVFEHLKNAVVGLERHLCASAFGGADFFDRVLGLTNAVFLHVVLARALDFCLEVNRECVHTRYPTPCRPPETL